MYPYMLQIASILNTHLPLKNHIILQNLTFCSIKTQSLWKHPTSYSFLSFFFRQVHEQGSQESMEHHNGPKNVVSLLHHGAHCASVVHIAAWWCTTTPYTIVVVHNVPWVNPDRQTDRQTDWHAQKNSGPPPLGKNTPLHKYLILLIRWLTYQIW